VRRVEADRSVVARGFFSEVEALPGRVPGLPEADDAVGLDQDVIVEEVAMDQVALRGDALGDGIVSAERLAKRNNTRDRERRAGLACCEEVLLVCTEADDVVTTCLTERECLRPDAGAERRDIADVAAAPGHQERLNAGHVNDHCQHSSKVGREYILLWFDCFILFEILKELLSQCRFDPFAVIQKLAPAGRALKMRDPLQDCARIAIDRGEKPAIGLEMVEPGTAADFFRISMRLLNIGKHCLQLLPACSNLGTAERADTVVISVREVNAHHTVRIGRITTKAISQNECPSCAPSPLAGEGWDGGDR
jgi:hypothetical protein